MGPSAAMTLVAINVNKTTAVIDFLYMVFSCWWSMCTKFPHRQGQEISFFAFWVKKRPNI
jgi:hypothetical protein